jgi:DNA-binding transcriptional regulator YiaG
MNHIDKTTNSNGGFGKPVHLWAIFPFIVAATGTTSATVLNDAALVAPLRAERTDAGQARKEEVEHIAGVSELRRLSGLTWEQVASLFDVSRRAVHHWASGKPMTAEHEAHLYRILASLRALHQGSVQPNRQVLFGSAEPGGRSVFDLLRERNYDEVTRLVGVPQSGSPVRSQIVVSADRLPSKPEQLVATEDESFDVKSGPRRRAKVVRATRA